MKMTSLINIFCIASLVFWAGGAWGEEFCVDPGGTGTHTDLNAALAAAAANGDDDIVRVAQGTYTGKFSYQSSEGNRIEILGGYVSGTSCTEREPDPRLTILDAAGSGTVLYLYNSNGGDIKVEGFTIQNGVASASQAGGLHTARECQSWQGKLPRWLPPRQRWP